MGTIRVEKRSFRPISRDDVGMAGNYLQRIQGCGLSATKKREKQLK